MTEALLPRAGPDSPTQGAAHPGFRRPGWDVGPRRFAEEAWEPAHNGTIVVREAPTSALERFSWQLAWEGEAAVGVEAAGVGGGDGVDGVADRRHEGVEGARRGPA